MDIKCHTPYTLDDALEIRANTGAIVLAGGTDLMVSAFRGIGITPYFDNDVMVIRNIPELSGIKKDEEGNIIIKACTTSREIAESPLVPWVLRQAAGKMGAIGLRNSATIGGNIANASPKGDMPGPLYLLDAQVELQSINGKRRVPIKDFILKLKTVDMGSDELITSVIIPYSDDDFDHFFYHKIGRRRANAISKLTVCSAIKFNKKGRVEDFRLATTACGVKTNRSTEVERLLIDSKRKEKVLAKILPGILDSFEDLLTPRAMPEYRKKSTRNLVADFLSKVFEGTAQKYNE